MGILNLEKLRDGLPGITKEKGSDLCVVCSYCLKNNSHNVGKDINVFYTIITGVEIKKYPIANTIEKKYKLLWDTAINQQVSRTYANKLEATEDGAVGIAIMLILEMTKYTIVKRSMNYTGFDYELAVKKTFHPFDKYDARLEVSGIWKGDRIKIKKRIRDKLKQTTTSDHVGKPAFVVIVEFSKPQSHIIERHGQR